MNWKLIGALAVGAGLLSACSGANQTQADSADRETQVEPGATAKEPPPPPPTQEKKDPAKPSEAVLHD